MNSKVFEPDEFEGSETSASTMESAQEDDQVNQYEEEQKGKDELCESVEVMKERRTYWQLVWSNREFRFYLASYIANHVGDWLTYIAAISAIGEIQLAAGMEKTSQTTIAVLMVIRLAPNVLMSPFGGVLADGRDRRTSMIALDLAGAIVALLFILALQVQSIPAIFVVSFLQECLCGLYEPSRSSIIPLLVPDDDDLKHATTLSGLAWSAVAAVGASAGGLIVSFLGLRWCFVIDSLTYLLSAILMVLMGGTWTVASETTLESPWAQVKGMFSDGVRYLRASSFGPLVFLKCSGALTYGANDVLNVAFVESYSVDERSTLLGLLFGAMGLGCLLGPVVVDRFTGMDDPRTILLACLYSIGQSSLASVFLGLLMPFWTKTLFTSIRAAGSAILWINSSLLLQKFTNPDMLGRVTSIEYALALLAEAVSAIIGGLLLDDANLSAEQVSLLLAFGGMVLLLCWGAYYVWGSGSIRYGQISSIDDREELSSSGISLCDTAKVDDRLTMIKDNDES